MTDYAELIAEAEQALFYTSGGEVSDIPERLAAALRECAVPEGWRVAAYERGEANGQCVYFDVSAKAWRIFGNIPSDKFPTASAAMAALDGESK